MLFSHDQAAVLAACERQETTLVQVTRTMHDITRHFGTGVSFHFIDMFGKAYQPLARTSFMVSNLNLTAFVI